MRTRKSFIVVMTVAGLAANTGACVEPKETRADDGERPIRTWTAVFVDAKTKSRCPASWLMRVCVSRTRKRSRTGC
jgi:hypothetical protein